MTDHPPQSFIEKIQKEVRMRPRWFFWLRTIGIAVGTTALAGVVVVAIGAVVFLWRSRELGELPGLGVGGIPPLLHYFPWHAAALSFAGLIGLLIILRRFTPGYKWPLLFLVALAVVGAAIFGALSSRAPFHGNLANRTLRGELPFLGGAYRPRFDDDHIVIGQITRITSNTLTVTTQESAVTVQISTDTRLPSRPLSVGQYILVLGNRSGKKMKARAIKIVQPPPGLFLGPPPSID